MRSTTQIINKTKKTMIHQCIQKRRMLFEILSWCLMLLFSCVSEPQVLLVDAAPNNQGWVVPLSSSSLRKNEMKWRKQRQQQQQQGKYWDCSVMRSSSSSSTILTTAARQQKRSSLTSLSFSPKPTTEVFSPTSTSSSSSVSYSSMMHRAYHLYHKKTHNLRQQQDLACSSISRRSTPSDTVVTWNKTMATNATTTATITISSSISSNWEKHETDAEGEKNKALLDRHSLDEINSLVAERSKARWDGNYSHADVLRQAIVTHVGIPSNYQILLRDIPRQQGGGSDWELVRCCGANGEDKATKDKNGPTILQLAHAALGLAVEASVKANLDRAQQSLLVTSSPLSSSHSSSPSSSSTTVSSSITFDAATATEESDHEMSVNTPTEHDIHIDQPQETHEDENNESTIKSLQWIVSQVKDRLIAMDDSMIRYELSGRKAADAAFWFALAGVHDKQIYYNLIQVTINELRRFGQRPSCRPKDIYQIMERFAAAGIQVPSPLRPPPPEAKQQQTFHDDDAAYAEAVRKLETVAIECLLAKEGQREEQQQKYQDKQQHEKNLGNNYPLNTTSSGDSVTKSSSLPSSTSLLDLHSDRSLLLLWKFSTKQKKQRAFLQSAMKHWKRHREQVDDEAESRREEDKLSSSLRLSRETKNITTTDDSYNNVEQQGHDSVDVDVIVDLHHAEACYGDGNDNDSSGGDNIARVPAGTAVSGRMPTMVAAATSDDVTSSWFEMFDDPTRPLIVDIGCGMGVSLLGLAKDVENAEGIIDDQFEKKNKYHSGKLLLNNYQENQNKTVMQMDWSDCNFVGVDLGSLGITYARNIAKRWKIDHRLQFVVESAETFLEQMVPTYPGPVALVMIQFPTPYQLIKEEKHPKELDGEEGNVAPGKNNIRGGGNSQLPSSADDGFMVTRELLRSINKVLSRKSSWSLSSSTFVDGAAANSQQASADHCHHDTNGKLLLQSNCEDVAVFMRNMACDECRFEFSPCSSSSSFDGHSEKNQQPKLKQRIPQRTETWMTMGGERASGPGWIKHPIFFTSSSPSSTSSSLSSLLSSHCVDNREGATETEVACELNGTPVHRCILQPSGN